MKLKKGKYKVTTTVRYRTYSEKVLTTSVKKPIRTVMAYSDVPVNCEVRNVRQTLELTYFDATCVGYTFDDGHDFEAASYAPSSGRLSVFNSDGSHLSGQITAMLTDGSRIALTLSPGFDLYQTQTVKQRSMTKKWSKTKTKNTLRS